VQIKGGFGKLGYSEYNVKSGPCKALILLLMSLAHQSTLNTNFASAIFLVRIDMQVSSWDPPAPPSRRDLLMNSRSGLSPMRFGQFIGTHSTTFLPRKQTSVAVPCLAQYLSVTHCATKDLI
jgi:hypothetical protein